ncbi:MAG: hypothetical protein U0234_00760 [Sandaracinus sp.]
MILTKEEADAVTQAAVRQTAKKLNVMYAETSSAEVLLPQIEEIDPAAYERLTAFLEIYGEWFRAQTGDVKHGQDPLSPEEVLARVHALRVRRDETRATLDDWLRG